MPESLTKVRRLKDARYIVERRDGACLALPLEQWKEALTEMDRLECFEQITTRRQSSENTAQPPAFTIFGQHEYHDSDDDFCDTCGLTEAQHSVPREISG